MDGKKAYELKQEVRSQRLAQLLQGLATLNGGAKQSIHYTDVSPRFLLLGVAIGGNHLFGTAVGSDKEGQPLINVPALQEIAKVFKSDLLSGLFAGLAKGYLDNQRAGLLEFLKSVSGSALVGSEKDVEGKDSRDVPHPVETIRLFSAELNARKSEWLA